MKECLVEKLKKAVDNNELLKIGEIKVTLSGTGEIRFSCSQVVNYSIDGIPQTPSERPTISVANETKNISLIGKYYIENVINYQNPVYATVGFDLKGLLYSNSLKSIAMGDGKGLYGNISALEGKTSITSLNMNSCDEVEGDLSSLSELSSVTELSLELCPLTGDLSSLSGLNSLTVFYCKSYRLKGSLTSLPASMVNLILGGQEITGHLSDLHNTNTSTRIYLDNTKVDGSIESFAEGIWNSGNGRTSGTLILKVLNTNCTFNGSSPLENYYYIRFYSDRIEIGYSSISTIATYDGTNWTYAN